MQFLNIFRKTIKEGLNLLLLVILVIVVSTLERLKASNLGQVTIRNEAINRTTLFANKSITFE